jgi:hypothetical protein
MEVGGGHGGCVKVLNALNGTLERLAYVYIFFTTVKT